MTEVQLPDRGGDTITCLEVESGIRLPRFPLATDVILKAWNNLPDLKCREDDVLLCSFPKTGTTWLFDVIAMILLKKTEPLTMTKFKTVIEAVPQEIVDTVSPPRILNTHVHHQLLPREIREKKIKTVLVMRNPKDTAVSFYNHCRSYKMYNYSGKWENWLPYYLNGEHEYGTYESYLSDWEKALEDTGFPLHVVYYEDMKEGGAGEIKRLARFLGVQDDKLCEDIDELCQFKNMKSKYPSEMTKPLLQEKGEIFRKGEVGDWKNWFTVAQNEHFDQLWNERMKTSKLQFKYVPSAGK